MKTISLSLLFVLLFSCSNKDSSKKDDDGNRIENESNNEENDALVVKKLTYTYPKNLLKKISTESEPIEFYCIGFNSNGYLAYIDRPCNGGCGCCTHDIIIQDLLTDKVVKSYSFLQHLNLETVEDHVEQWNKLKEEGSQFLRVNNIEQIPIGLNNNSSMQYGGHSFQIKFSTKSSQNPAYDIGSDISYTVRMEIDGEKSKIISSGKITEGYFFKYLGYLKSPFNNQVAILFQKSMHGFEGETINEVLVVGCTLDPIYF